MRAGTDFTNPASVTDAEGLLIFPAIDLMSGQAVRLRQGRAADRTVFPGPPQEWARRWEAAGGDWLHVVDLDAAFTGTAANLDAVKTIRDTIGIPLQLGGGLRTLPAIERVLDVGIHRVVIGTKAAESLDFVADAVRNFGGSSIAVGIDAIDGRVAVRGWTEASDRDALDLVREVSTLGIDAIIYTDVATDGMMAGPNLPALRAVLADSRVKVIASGGVSSAADLDALSALPGLHGAIVGRALFDGALDLPAWKRARGA